MILQIDAGNSRVHWRLLDERRIPLRRGDQSWEDGLEALAFEKVTSLEFASVAGARADALKMTLAHDTRAPIRDFGVFSHQCGVTNAYSDPSRMGVDRWLAMIGGFHAFGGPLTVLDAGTAITIDYVDVRGVHRGGYILPGLGLMKESLGAGTSGVRADPASGGDMGPGTSTTECVHQGIAWLFDTMVVRAGEYWGKSKGRLIVTGGDADRMPDGLGAEVVREPDLVFLGMDTVVAGDHPGY